MNISMVNREDSKLKTKKRKDGTVIGGRDYIRTALEGREVVPESFTAVVDNETLGAHFHDVDQFQIMFGVPGATFQRKPIPELMIHYVDSFVTYGPIVATESAFEYFTLRSRMSTGIWYMPQDREQLPYRGARHFEYVPEGFRALAGGKVQSETAFEDATDGLEARIITAGGGGVIVANASSSLNGQYVVIVDGSLEFENKAYERWSIGWQDSTDGLVELKAGPEGCRALILRFPSPATSTAHAVELAKVPTFA